MEFILKTDLEKAMPTIIDFNFEALKSELKERLIRYEGLIVTEDSIREAKADKATLNTLRTAIEDKRKDVKKQCLKPYEEFEVKIKEIVAMIDKPILAIDGQVKGFENAIKEEKLNSIKEYFQSEVKDLERLLPFERIYNEKWLNSGYKIAEIQKEIKDTIFKVDNDLRIITAMKCDCETQMKYIYLKTLDMSSALAEKTKFEEETKKMAEYKAKVEPVKTDAVQEQQMPPVEQISDIVFPMDFRVWVTDPQLRALKQFLLNNNIKYGRVE